MLRRRRHARHHPGAEQGEPERRPDPAGRALAKKQRAADDRQNRRDIADERGVGDLGARQRDMKRADVDRESEAGETERQRNGGDVLRRRPAPAPSCAQIASTGTASPMRQAAPASGPTSRKRASTPDQAMMPVPTIKEIQPVGSDFAAEADGATDVTTPNP